ncbi:hypothetical protein OEZ85_003854 [Tetradesmus obliquus]|uniref:HAUS augmin-like complex subunit 6 N-terminal domain-containing protein n=1 Tax=Tetradesmus obliquus TaxID=3088 RepID=A0ABY8UCX0_TETOB|nr:hypothetical protein OEZ85_003854 [Tetradesmus obliquus]
MEKEVSRWLHQQLGYNAAADSTLSANCRGNLKSLWEFLMANYKSPENQRHIHNVLAKHRREQEAARQAPERAQQALQQRQHLAQLEAKAATLERSLASLQAAVHSSNQDAAEQSGEQGLFKQELHETQTQTSISQQQQQSDKAAAFQSPEMLVKQRQQMHVQLYVQAKASAAAAAEAEVQLEQLMGAVPLLSGAAAGSWESQLAALWLRAEGLRAELAVLTQRKAEFEQDVDACIQAEAHLQEKWDLIKAAVREDAELNDLLYRVAADNMELYAGLHSQRDQARSLLLEQLAPTAAAASRSADAGRDELAREAGVVARLPVCGALPPQRLGAAAGGAGAASTTLATITRLQLASQQLSHLGRPTTAPKAFTAARLAGAAAPAAGAAGSGGRSSGSGVDAAAVSALRAACSVDAVAPVRCPAALLLEVADECRQLQQLQQQLDRLSSFCRGAAASAAQAADEAVQLQEQVEALRASDTQQVLPWLVELLEGGQQQRATKLREVSSDLQHFWEMPAQHLLPGTKHEGKSCSEWLQEIQALHGRKRELSSQTN